jgi:hypothetical protein
VRTVARIHVLGMSANLGYACGAIQPSDPVDEHLDVIERVDMALKLKSGLQSDKTWPGGKFD